MTQTYPAPDFFTALTQKPSRALWWAIALYVLVYRIITPPVNAMVMDTGAALIFTRAC